MGKTMTISEMISKLDMLKRGYGDLPVRVGSLDVIGCFLEKNQYQTLPGGPYITIGVS